MPEHQVIKTPQALAHDYWRDLIELVEQGEISVRIAERIRNDMFEEYPPTAAPKLRESVWCAHVKEVTGDSS